MLANLIQKVKDSQSGIILSVVVVLITIISFQSGRIFESNQNDSKRVLTQEANSGEIFGNNEKESQQRNNKNNEIEFQVVASKNSSKYHFPWCSGAAKISERNKIIFLNESAAISAGLTLAANCKK